MSILDAKLVAGPRSRSHEIFDAAAMRFVLRDSQAGQGCLTCLPLLHTVSLLSPPYKYGRRHLEDAAMLGLASAGMIWP